MWQAELPTRVETDTSAFTVSGIISQKHKDGLWHPIAYRSENLSAPERNYEIYDRKLLAVIHALEDWRHYLQGLPEPFEIITDHENLKYWKTSRHLNRRQAQWYLTLSSYDFVLTHKPGKKHVAPDALTRRSSDEVKDSEDNHDIIMLKPEQFLSVSATSHESDDAVSLEEMIRNSLTREAEVLRSVEQLKTVGFRKMIDGSYKWEEEDGLIYHLGKLYVPKEARRAVLQSCHDTPGAGHPGSYGTTELVMKTYWWPTLKKDTADYVAGCDTCQRNKAAVHPTATIHLIDPPTGLWEVVGQDLIVGLPEVNGYNAILTFVDHKGKQCHFIPTSDTVDSSGIAEIYFREIFRLHGMPRAFISDRGPQFASKMMRALLGHLGIKSSLTTAYHPQANGQTEHMNKEVSQYLRLYCNQRQTDWVKHLPRAEFVINNCVNTSTGYSPLERRHRRQPL